MTVSATSPYVRHVCTGSTSYAYLFKIYETSDLVVKRITSGGVTTTLVETTDYSVSDNGDGSGGTITTVATYSDGYIQITRELPFTQATDFVDGGALPAETLEEAFDRAVLLIQQLESLVTEGALGVTWKGDWATTTAYTVLDIVLNGSNWYVCTVSHTAGASFSTDLGLGYWRLFLEQPSSHSIASHSDTTATGTEMETLTDNSMADTLHRHSELSASDGTPDQALTVDGDGKVTLGSGTGVNEFSIDGTMAGNSDDAVPTEKAVKTYVDAFSSGIGVVVTGEEMTGNMVGLDMSVAADTEHDVTIAIGNCTDSTNATAMSLSTALTKQLDAAWSAGTNAGAMRASGALPTSGYVNLWLIAKADGTTDVMATESGDTMNATNLNTWATGYTLFRWLGFIRTTSDSPGNIAGFKMSGNHISFSKASENIITALLDSSFDTYDHSADMPESRIDSIEYAYTGGTANWVGSASDDGTNVAFTIGVTAGTSDTINYAWGSGAKASLKPYSATRQFKCDGTGNLAVHSVIVKR